MLLPGWFCLLYLLNLLLWFFWPTYGLQVFLQCMISILTQGAQSGHLFGLICSAVLWKGRNTRNTPSMCGNRFLWLDHTRVHHSPRWAVHLPGKLVLFWGTLSRDKLFGLLARPCRGCHSLRCVMYFPRGAGLALWHVYQIQATEDTKKPWDTQGS